MPGPSGYPKELNHPCGFKTVMAYDADDERAFHKMAKSFRDEMQEAHASALRGETIKAPKAAKTVKPGEPVQEPIL